jgi:hypothetical protein
MEQTTQQPDADEMQSIADDRLCVSQPTRSSQACRYLTFDEFKRRVPLSASTIWRRLGDGSIPSVQPGGKGHRVLIPESALNMSCQIRPAESSELADVGQAVKTAEVGPAVVTPPRKSRLSGPRPKWKSRDALRR